MSRHFERPHTVGGAIVRRARRTPEAPAILGGDGECITFSQVAADIARARGILAAAGLGRSDRIGVIQRPGLNSARALVAFACNAAVVPIDAASAPMAMRAIVESAQIKAFAIAGPEGVALEGAALQPQAQAVPRPAAADDVALVIPVGSRLITLTHRHLRLMAAKAAAGRAGVGAASGLLVPLILGKGVVPNVAGVPGPEEGVDCANAPTASALSEPADDLLEMEVRDVWKRLLQRDDVGWDENFLDAGGDSLLATQLLLELEALAGRPYPESELSQLTVRRIAEVLKAQIPAERRCITAVRAPELESVDVWQRLRAVRRMARMLGETNTGWATRVGGEAGMPFFFCHGDFQARGLYAHQLASLLPADQPVYLLHPEQEPAAGTTAEELAERYLEEVLRVAPAGPVVVGGYCNGGYAAWHLAHLLRKRRIEVAALFLVETPSFNAQPLVRAAARFFRAAGAILPGKLGQLASREAMRGIWSLYRHGVHAFLGRLFHVAGEMAHEPATVPSWWLFVRSMATRYVPPPLDVPLHCFLAEEADRLDTEPARWKSLVAQVAEVTVPGTHRSAVVSHRPALAAAFVDALREAARGRTLSAPRAAPRRAPCPSALGRQPG